MAQNDIFRLAVIGIGPSAQELVNVHHFRQTTALGSDDGSELIQAWIEDAQAAHLACLASSISVTGYQVRNITQPLFGSDFALTPAEAGDLAGDALPPTAPAIITWRTGLIGRSRRGRTYMWPATEAQQIGGQVQGPYAVLLGTFAEAFAVIADSVSSAGYAHVVYSPTLTQAFTRTTYQVQDFLGRMGSRRSGTGS